MNIPQKTSAAEVIVALNQWITAKTGNKPDSILAMYAALSGLCEKQLDEHEKRKASNPVKEEYVLV